MTCKVTRLLVNNGPNRFKLQLCIYENWQPLAEKWLTGKTISFSEGKADSHLTDCSDAQSAVVLLHDL